MSRTHRSTTSGDNAVSAETSGLRDSEKGGLDVMQPFVTSFVAIAIASLGLDGDNRAFQAVLPTIIYRDYLFTHSQFPIDRSSPYTVIVRPLNNPSLRVMQDMPGHPKNNFESL